MSLKEQFMMLPALIVGLTVHEFAHAWTASLLGDRYARRLGRVSLNPLRHLSLLGTLAILLLPIGWGKPVPINLYNFKHPRRDYLLTSLAGPAANFLLAAIFLGLMQLTRHTDWFSYKVGLSVDFAHAMLALGIILNVILAFINLVPIPPLDGSHIWPCLIPGQKLTMSGKTSMVFMVLCVLILTNGSFGKVIGVVVDHVMSVAPITDRAASNSLAEQAWSAYEEGQYQQSRQLADKAIARFRHNASAHCVRALVCWHENDLDQAVQEMNRAIDLWPVSADYYHYRSLIQSLRGEKELALADQELAEVFGWKNRRAESAPAESQDAEAK